MATTKKKTVEGINFDAWDVDDIQDAGSKGFNYIKAIPKIFESVIPDVKIGLFTEEDLPGMQAQRWFPLTPEELGHYVEDVNNAVPLRFGCTVRNGAICYRDLYVCFMPTFYREAMLKKRHAENAESRRKILETTPGLGPQHERFNEPSDTHAQAVLARGGKVKTYSRRGGDPE